MHQAEVDSNDYGAFLFITVSYPEQNKLLFVTFFGYGYHEYRERWYMQQWVWYESYPFPENLKKTMTRDQVDSLLRIRQEEIASYVTEDHQTGRGRLFEMIADLMDDDDAMAEMEELGDLWHYLGDGLE